MKTRVLLAALCAAVLGMSVASPPPAAAAGWYWTNYAVTRTFNIQMPTTLFNTDRHVFEAKFQYPDNYPGLSKMDEVSISATLIFSNPGPPGLTAGGTIGARASNLVAGQSAVTAFSRSCSPSTCLVPDTVNYWANVTWAYNGGTNSHFPRLDMAVTRSGSVAIVRVTIRDGGSAPANTWYGLSYAY